MKDYVCIPVLAAILLVANFKANPQTISFGDQSFQVMLGQNENKIPYIAGAQADGKPVGSLNDNSRGGILEAWLHEQFLTVPVDQINCNGWKTTEDSVFYKAVANIEVNGLALQFNLQLVKGHNYTRQFFTLRNSGADPLVINNFPILLTRNGFTNKNTVIHSWKSLHYTPQHKQLTDDTDVILSSSGHSSDNTRGWGNVPYWMINNKELKTFYSLAWCGGWKAKLESGKAGLDSRVYLTQAETQVKIKPGESIKGPVVYIYVNHDPYLPAARREWFQARDHLANALYPLPEFSFPFVYNHWYAVEFDIDGKFMKKQLPAVNEMGFDVFVVDAGWYNEVGNWVPDKDKFRNGSFQEGVSYLKENNIELGIWSSPHLMRAQPPLSPRFEQPERYVSFMDSYLLDLTSMDFTSYLDAHLDTLTNILGASWWKFDQDFFGDTSRHGKMRNVVSLQEALSVARKNYPGLVIESCMGGGKMINEFTDMISQIHWIRDGDRSGYIHALDNIKEANGASGFLMPEKIERWVNRIEEIDENDTELIKFYCRSCMLGTWGISSNLNKVSEKTKSIIKKEENHYRQINELKKHKLYDFEPILEYTRDIYTIFYNPDYTEAAIILYRIIPHEKGIKRTIQTHLKSGEYVITNAGTGKSKTIEGSGVNLELPVGKMSAIYFISKQ
jgi:hypothetical protein